MFDWLGLKKFATDPNALTNVRMRAIAIIVLNSVTKPAARLKPQRGAIYRPAFEDGLRKNFSWFFNKFYPSA